jgi:hypothetical protein
VKEFLRGSSTVLLHRIGHLEKLLARVPDFPSAQQKCEEVRVYLRQLHDGVTDVLSSLPAPQEELKNLVDQYNALAVQFICSNKCSSDQCLAFQMTMFASAD